MGPKLMNCYKPEPMCTQEYAKNVEENAIQVLEDGRVPAKEARSWRIEGQKRSITSKEYQRLVNKFEMEGFYGAKRLVEPCEGEKSLGKEERKKVML